MRLLVVFAGFAAAVSVATPAQADPGSNDSGPDASFLAALDKAGVRDGAEASARRAGQAGRA